MLIYVKEVFKMCSCGKWICMVVAAILGCMSTSVAGAERSITLEECLKLTLGYSHDVLIAKEGKNLSEGRYIEERAAALPLLKSEVSTLRTFTETPVYPGVDREKNDYHMSLDFSQPLFTWGQIGAAIKAAKHDRTAAEHQIEQAKQLALREAATSFFDLLLTLELAKVARDNVAQKQRHLDETERKFRMEVATDYDVLSARVALTNALPALTQAENDIRLAKDRLRYYMGIEEDFEVSGMLDSRLARPEPLAQVLAKAEENRPEVAYYESRVGVFKELVKVARGGNKPRLDLKGNIGRDAFESIEKDIPGQHWNAGVYLSFPLFEGFQTKGRVIQAKSRLATTELEMKRLLDQIALDAREAINRVDEAVQIVKGLEATTQQAERLLEMAENGYRHGVKTKLEVDDAEFNLLSARTNLARARRDYLAARTRLLWIMGEDLLTALANGQYNENM